MILKILCCEDYIDVFKTVKIQDNQKALKSEIILKINSNILSNQSIIDDLESLFMLRDLFIFNQSIRKVLTSRKKNCLKKSKYMFLKLQKNF